MMRLGRKKIMLDQLQAELVAAGLPVANGLGVFGDWIYPYDDNGEPTEFLDQTIVANVLASHAPVRSISDQELNFAYLDAVQRGDQSAINHVMAQAHNLIARDKVPADTVSVSPPVRK